MSQALHLKHRPQEFDQMAGNETSIEMLCSVLDRDYEKIPRSLLFTGESGTGKTTIVRIVKEELACSDADFHLFNTSNTRGIDTIREMQKLSRLAPMDGDLKIFFLEECHQLTKPAQDAMLLMLEDAPPNTFFFLATTNPEKLKKAVKTRCTTIKLKTLSYKVITDYLRTITEAEGIEDYPKKILTAIAKASQGSCREAVKILDQVIDIEDDETALEAVESSLGSESDIAELCKALLNGSKWKVIAEILKTLDMEPESARLVILKWFNKVLLDKGEQRVAEMMELFEKNYYDSGKAGLTNSCYAASLL